jgi:hypothetical protein
MGGRTAYREFRALLVAKPDYQSDSDSTMAYAIQQVMDEIMKRAKSYPKRTSQ